MLPNLHRIPLETAHEFLATFGITKPTKEYERWVKEDGFDFEDFPTVLADSPYIFLIDWRANLADELPPIVEALAQLEVTLESDVDGTTSTGFVANERNKLQVKYVPTDQDDFTDVIIAIQSLVPETIEFRASPHNGQRDQWDFAVLPREQWAELEALDSELVNSLFVPLSNET